MFVECGFHGCGIILDLDFGFIMLLLFDRRLFLRVQHMGFRELLGKSVFTRVILVLWLVSSVFVLLLLSKIDGIVHGELYNYGLQFSFAWASPYWAFVRLVMFV